jgi:hypothetical protein
LEDDDKYVYDLKAYTSVKITGFLGRFTGRFAKSKMSWASFSPTKKPYGKAFKEFYKKPA